MAVDTMIPFGKPMIGDEERDAVAEVLAGTTLTHGPLVKEFEAAFAEFTGAPHAIATHSRGRRCTSPTSRSSSGRATRCSSPRRPMSPRRTR